MMRINTQISHFLLKAFSLLIITSIWVSFLSYAGDAFDKNTEVFIYFSDSELAEVRWIDPKIKKLFVIVNDPDQNHLPHLVETMHDALTLATTKYSGGYQSNSVKLSLTETGLNTGFFVSDPIILEIDEFVSPRKSYSLKASYADPDDPLDTLTVTVHMSGLWLGPPPCSPFSQSKTEIIFHTCLNTNAISILEVRVFDRTGKLIWIGSSQSNLVRWNGRSTKEKLANGVYLYLMIARTKYLRWSTRVSSVLKFAIVN